METQELSEIEATVARIIGQGYVETHALIREGERLKLRAAVTRISRGLVVRLWAGSRSGLQLMVLQNMLTQQECREWTENARALLTKLKAVPDVHPVAWELALELATPANWRKGAKVCSRFGLSPKTAAAFLAPYVAEAGSLGQLKTALYLCGSDPRHATTSPE